MPAHKQRTGTQDKTMNYNFGPKNAQGADLFGLYSYIIHYIL